MEVVSQTHQGMIRDHNEDSFLVDESLGLYIVADGMGGHRAGDVASRIAVDAVRKRLQNALAGSPLSDADLALEVSSAVEFANQEIRSAALRTPDQKGMGTTIVLILVRGGKAVLAHVGDSRAYRWRGADFAKLTQDHSLLQEQVGAGVLTNREAKFSHNRNLVTRALGVEPRVEVEVQPIDIRQGDTFLLCSDGLNTMVDDIDIHHTMREVGANLPLAGRCLVEIANDNGGHDNVTLLLLRVNEVKPPEEEAGFGRRLMRMFGL
ncbi:MAG: Stp1/IreP family PP2C-type Ser/Thr phosphatase [Betaproteobacteria bacterium]|nr:Stp1/IreP family PP2C-type Ser/Thr phosphatase [Betaproteobacteria bacterium]